MNIFIRNCLLATVCLIYLIFPFKTGAFSGEMVNLTKASPITDNVSPILQTSETINDEFFHEKASPNDCLSKKIFLHLGYLINPLPINKDNNIDSDVIENNIFGLWTGMPCKDIDITSVDVMFRDYRANHNANNAVNEQVRIFSRAKGGIFVEGLSRAASFMPILKKMLAKDGLPEDLAIVPLIESGYNNNAQANGDDIAGPWQIMKWTARRFGLKINYWVDERHDPIKSTTAATKYLKLLFDKFGSWELALAAYNSGEGTVAKAMDKSNTADFWALYKSKFMSQQVSYYVHKFIAAREITDKLGEYGYAELKNQPLMRFDTVIIEPPADLSYIAKATGTTVGRIKELNPELKQWCIPPDVKTYELRIPSGSKTMFLADYNNRLQPEFNTSKTYVVKKGDTVYSIARKKRVPIKTLLEANNLNHSSQLNAGTVLILIAKNDNKKSFKKPHSKKRASHEEV
jgi:membrane-bound lytic murein transglycosylase D